ncbi:major capsid protein [Gordonia sp. CPCC 206044]|uniref:major capsid protein n=1 Tax=Gordonia sp. CPCC 206044 TaxID=3140793 RepID=UPI003AF3F800
MSTRDRIFAGGKPAIKSSMPWRGPQNGVLLPRFDLPGQELTVSGLLAQPSVIRSKIAETAEGSELLSAFFTGLAQPVQGGGILHTRLRTEDRYTEDDVVARAPGDEYQRVRAVDPEFRLALVEDYGGWVDVTDEEVDRSDMSTFTNKMSQLRNTLVRKLNLHALDAVDAADLNTFPAVQPWPDLVTVGPPESLTPNASRPLADLITVRTQFFTDRLGFTPDTLLCGPTDAEALAIGYGEEMTKVLDSVGLTLEVNPYIQAGRVYVLARGKVGVVGYERELTVDVIDERAKRSTRVQAYAVPAFAVDKPQACKVITGTTAPENP